MGTDSRDRKHKGRYTSIPLLKLRRSLDFSGLHVVIGVEEKKNNSYFSCKRLILANSVIRSVVFHAGPALILEICQNRTVKELDDLESISVKAILGQMVVKMLKFFG